jgi:hypothetical protein
MRKDKTQSLRRAEKSQQVSKENRAVNLMVLQET